MAASTWPALFIVNHVLFEIDEMDGGSIELLNHKSVLQERTQAMGLPMPRYATVGTERAGACQSLYG